MRRMSCDRQRLREGRGCFGDWWRTASYPENGPRSFAQVGPGGIPDPGLDPGPFVLVLSMPR